MRQVGKIVEQHEVIKIENRLLQVRAKRQIDAARRQAEALGRMEQEQDAMDCTIGDLERQIEHSKETAENARTEMERQHAMKRDHIEHQQEILQHENEILRQRSQRDRETMGAMTMERAEMQETIARLASQLDSAQALKSRLTTDENDGADGLRKLARTSRPIRGVILTDRSSQNDPIRQIQSSSADDPQHPLRTPSPESLVYLGSRSTLRRTYPTFRK
jgi:hypothetical protein